VGPLHVGHHAGAIENWLTLQDEHDVNLGGVALAALAAMVLL
jgi:tryptophanyl-tRNA synthetase